MICGDYCLRRVQVIKGIIGNKTLKEESILYYETLKKKKKK